MIKQLRIMIAFNADRWYLPFMRLITITLFAFLLPTVILALDPVVLTDQKGEYPLGLHLEYLEDKTGKLTIEQVRLKEIESKWVRNSGTDINFGFTKSAYWLRLRIRNNSDNGDWRFELANPLLDNVRFYIVNQYGKYSKKIVGDLYPFSNREIRHRNFVFAVPIEKGTEKTLYLRVKTISWTTASINLMGCTVNL